MLNNRHGQAKILTSTDMESLLKAGLVSARDQAFFMVCFYTGCRLSEARQLPYNCAFHEGEVLEEMVFPKAITKSKQSTRSIPTHPCLAKFLEKYHQESLEIVELRKTFGHWSHLNLTEDGYIKINQFLMCPKCSATHIIRHGIRNQKQCYLCKKCKHGFDEDRAVKSSEPEKASAMLACPLGIRSSNNYGSLFTDPNNPFLFPGRNGKGCLSKRAAFSIFENAYRRVIIVGAGSHSCRRTALTTMHSAGVTLRVLQEISGHRDLGALQRYLEVSEEEMLSAINLLN